jgi:hypothetical protein
VQLCHALLCTAPLTRRLRHGCSTSRAVPVPGN